jgi:hypothetical protein
VVDGGKHVRFTLMIFENVLRLYLKINVLSREWSDYRRVLA